MLCLNSLGIERHIFSVTNMLHNKKYRGSIIPCETFDYAQKLFKTHSTTRKSFHIYIFKGICVCGKCGRNMYGNTFVHQISTGKKRYYRYRCSSFEYGKKCTMISELRLEQMVLEQLTEIIGSSDIWKIEPEDTNDENIKEELKKNTVQTKQIV